MHQNQHMHTQLRPKFQQKHTNTHTRELSRGKGTGSPGDQIRPSNRVRRRRGHPRRSSLSLTSSSWWPSREHGKLQNCITEITPLFESPPCVSASECGDPLLLALFNSVYVSVRGTRDYRVKRSVIIVNGKLFFLRGTLSHALHLLHTLTFSLALFNECQVRRLPPETMALKSPSQTKGLWLDEDHLHKRLIKNALLISQLC